jgi:O-antigen ligase/tetratricopeptide (TPR) repeat protein
MFVTRIGGGAAALAESAWLAAIVAIPVFFNVYGERGFEADKVHLLRSFATVCAAGLVVALADRETARGTASSPWCAPVVRAALAVVLVSALAAVLGVAPLRSFWGSYDRVQGTITQLAYFAFFLAIVFLARRARQRRRLVDALLLASAVPALYAVVQHFGIDPIAWGSEEDLQRVHSTAGNAVFLAAYLIMAAPLALARAVAPSSAERPTVAAALPYLALLTLQLLALLYTQSRGPLLALAVGLGFFFSLLAALRQWRACARGVASLALAGLAVTAILRLPGAALLPRDDTAQLLSPGEGSSRVRVLIWESAIELLATEPTRLATGWGPENFFLVYNRVHRPELERLERRNRAPDRTHNDIFDALVDAGVIGAVAQIGFFTAIFAALLRGLGLLEQRRGFVLCVLGGSAAGAAVARLALGTFAYLGVGTAAGFAVGVLAWVTGAALSPVPRRSAERAAPILAGIFAAVMAHFAEIQVGLTTAATRLDLFVLAGIACGGVSAFGGAAGEGEEPEPLLTGTLVALALCLLFTGLLTPTVNLAAFVPAWLIISAGVWLLGAALVLGRRAAEERRGGLLFDYLATSGAFTLAFDSLYLAWIARTPLDPAQGDPVASLGYHLASAVAFAWTGVAAATLLGAAAVARRQADSPPARRRFAGVLLATTLLGLAVYFATAELRGSQADVFTKIGTRLEAEQRWLPAERAHAEALRLQPQEERLSANLARTMFERARRHPDGTGDSLVGAAALLRDAAQRAPLDPDHPTNLGRLYRFWAIAGPKEERGARFAQAAAAYETALALRPRHSGLWKEVATLRLQRGEHEAAQQALARAAELAGGGIAP